MAVAWIQSLAQELPYAACAAIKKKKKKKRRKFQPHFFFFFRAAPTAYGSFQARGQKRAVVARPKPQPQKLGM